MFPVLALGAIVVAVALSRSKRPHPALDRPLTGEERRIFASAEDRGLARAEATYLQ